MPPIVTESPVPRPNAKSEFRYALSVRTSQDAQRFGPDGNIGDAVVASVHSVCVGLGFPGRLALDGSFSYGFIERISTAWNVALVPGIAISD